MSDGSAIQWTDATWNPTTGCTKVSPGCANCYIERTPAFRIAGRRFDAKAHIPLQFHDNRLEQPLHWKKPRRVFVNSLSDLFHDDVPIEFIGRVFNVMGNASRHTFQVLTKRPERMRAVVKAYYDALGDFQPEPYRNVWLGVSVENQHFADERIPLLLQTPAAVRFISAEPLLGPVNLEAFLQYEPFHEHYKMTLGAQEWRGIDWVIVGGESGPKSRPCDLAWVRSIVQQCQTAGVACFVKQLGSNPETQQGCEDCDPCLGGASCPQGYNIRMALRDKKGGDPAEWPADLRVREFPTVTR